MIPRAERLSGQVDDTITNTQAKALVSLWLIDGNPGLWRYSVGVGLRETVAPDGCVVAETNGSLAIFSRERSLESILCRAMGVNAPA